MTPAQQVAMRHAIHLLAEALAEQDATTYARTSERDRLAVNNLHVFGFGIDEIATDVGLAPSTVRKIINARKAAA